MKQTGARPLLILAALTAIGILAVVVWAASQRSASPGVHIGTAVSITRPHASGYTVGAAFRHFATATVALSCGAPTSGVTWNGSSATQQFAPNCAAHARFRLTTPTPQPQPTGPAPTPTAAPRPTGTPLPLPSVTPSPSSPTAYLLSLLNGHRAAVGVAPLALSDVQSMGTATCAGSIGHSQAMQQSGSIWHVAPTQYPQYDYASFPKDICLSAFAMGENVGDGTGSEQSATQSIDGAMMNEPHDAATCAAQVNHACSILNPRYTQIGIGLVYINSVLFLTEDFVG